MKVYVISIGRKILAKNISAISKFLWEFSVGHKIHKFLNLQIKVFFDTE